MSRFKKEKKGGSPGLSTASLPDIVFMLLFFFMVATVMREMDLMVDIKQPEAKEIIKLENRKLVGHIYVGYPLNKNLGNEPRMQLNDQLVDDATRIEQWLQTTRAKIDESEQSKFVVSLKVDEKCKMGIVNRIKYELRNNKQFQINYAASAPKVER